MKKTLRMGTRKSPLALIQVREILEALKKVAPKIKTKIVAIDTVGDRDKKTPISEMEGTDFFTREIDKALLKRKIDCAVHSAKDLPDQISDGIVVAATTVSVDPYDVLVSKNHLKLDALPEGARIGTSSERRKNQIRAYRPDLEIVDIRGTIGERLELLKSGNLDAIVIAAAGLIRLGLGHHITERLKFDVLTPHPLQGALAVTVRSTDRALKKLFSKLNGKKIASYKTYSGRSTAQPSQTRAVKKVLVTGTSVERFKHRGEIIHVPMIEIQPAKNMRLLDQTVRKLDRYDGILFTSRHAVQYFLERVMKKFKSVRTIKGKTIIAIGKATAERLEDFGLSADMVPRDESAEGIIRMLKKVPLRGKYFLIPRSNLARDYLVKELRKAGARVDAVTAYRNVRTKTKKIDLMQMDEIIFTSPSTVKNFFETYDKIPAATRVKAIGPVTKACLEEYGQKAEVIG